MAALRATPIARLPDRRPFIISSLLLTARLPTLADLMDRTTLAEGGAAYDVVGSTGSLYRVKITYRPTCSCPDFRGKWRCKHVLFVYLKFLRMPQVCEPV